MSEQKEAGEPTRHDAAHREGYARGIQQFTGADYQTAWLAASGTSSGTSVGPHRFDPLRFWDRRAGGRCRACYLPEIVHPLFSWVPARPIGDKRPASTRIEAWMAVNP